MEELELIIVNDEADKQYKMIIDNFIYNMNHIWRLNIPQVINECILMFYDKGRYFKEYNETKFNLSSNDRIITPNDEENKRGANYMIYPSPNGFTEGTHIWSVKYMKDNGHSYFERSIGVTTELNQRWISKGFDANKCLFDDDKYSSYFDGAFLNDWSCQQTILVSLNMDRRIVRYFRDGKRVQRDYLDKDVKIFYFALCINSGVKCGSFQSD